jgi:hypothetical protein
MELTDLILTARADLSRFDYDNYPLCFARFRRAAAPLLTALGRAPEESAAALLDELAQRREALPRRARAETARQDKQVLALFLTPAARQCGPEAMAFAAALRDLWNRTYPRNPYAAGTYESIMKGFDAHLLGLPLRKSRRRD